MLDGKEMFFLNRLIRYVADGTDGKRLEVEADARHAEILMRSFGFDSKTKGTTSRRTRFGTRTSLLKSAPRRWTRPRPVSSGL